MNSFEVIFMGQTHRLLKELNKPAKCTKINGELRGALIALNHYERPNIEPQKFETKVFLKIRIRAVLMI